MTATLTEQQTATLTALCDTIVPSLHRDDDPTGFWARRASDVGAEQALLQAIDAMAPEQQAGLAQLLDALAMQDFAVRSQLSREQILTNMSLASRDAAAGLGALVSLTL